MKTENEDKVIYAEKEGRNYYEYKIEGKEIVKYGGYRIVFYDGKKTCRQVRGGVVKRWPLDTPEFIELLKQYNP